MQAWLRAENVLDDAVLDNELVCAVCQNSFICREGVTAPRFWAPNWKEFNCRWVIACSFTCILKWADCSHIKWMHGPLEEIRV